MHRATKPSASRSPLRHRPGQAPMQRRSRSSPASSRHDCAALGAGCGRRDESVMDGGTIQQALLMILNVIIAALVGALTALSASYFRTRGQNLATKHDFVELLNQLKTNT